MGRDAQPNRPLDATDRKLIALLRRDSKRTFADLGGEVSLSATAVKRRVDRLQRDGVIQGYGAIVDPQMLGEGLEALVEIYCSDSTAPIDVKASVDMPEVVTAFTVSGEPDALVRVRVDSIRHLEKVVEHLRRDPNIVRTRTLIVLSTIIDRLGPG
jgi:Lrp/AsnC family transcriptional regulator, leucine-responsive regulatory protein